MKSIELFAGAGGLALGLEKAGFKTQLLVENDKWACKTLQENKSEWNVINKNISLVDFTAYRDKIDLLSGGFPCQAFSHAGKRLGFEDIRGTLFFEMARAIKEINPKMIMAENVKGFSTHDKGKTLKVVLSVFDELGYKMHHKLINSWDQNVPQKRERYIMIGLRKDLEEITSFNYPENLLDKPILRDVLINVPKSNDPTYSVTKLKYFNLIPEGGNWKSLKSDLQIEYMGNAYYSGGGKTGFLKRLHMDHPSMTILTSPAQKQTERCHPKKVRPLTIRESARIQTFPDSWEFIGSTSNQYKQIGNAVPVNLAFNIGKELIKTLEKTIKKM
jgi:DNA (cytosine-5)-methyltransferase 1